MTTADIVLGIVLIIASLFLIISVLMQHGKDHSLSGTIAGGAETFFGKSKGQTIDKKLSTLTTVIAIIFVGLVLAVYLMQDSTDTSGLHSSYTGDAAETQTVTGEGTGTSESTESVATDTSSASTDTASQTEKSE